MENLKRIDEILEGIFNPEMTELLHVYRDELVLTQPRMIYRVDGGGGDRYYYRIEETNEGNQFIFYPSTTTFTKKVLPTSPFLLQWMKSNGEEADKIRDLAADYGTLMHICLADFLTHGWDFSATRQLVTKYVERLGHPRYFISKWTQKLNKNIASFKQFCNDYEIEPILIEVMLASDEIGIAGALDCVCKMYTPELAKAFKKSIREYESASAKFIERKEKALEKGKEFSETFDLVFPSKPEKINGQLDFKSGGIYDSSELQLAINKMIFHENYPEVELTCSLNWSPKDWETVPTYTVVDQTDTRFGYDQIDAFLTIYNCMYPDEISDKKVFFFNGLVENDLSPIGEKAGITTLYKSIENSYNLKSEY